MKVKGLRWVVLSLIVLVTIINYLDRGTLNYMWVANTKVEVPAGEWSVVDSTNLYLVQAKEGVLELNASDVTVAENGTLTYVEYGGIAKDLGLVDTTASQEEQQKQAKSMLAVITMFFMIAYGISQLFSGKVYDKIGTRKGFTLSAILWGAA
ncbi:MAG: MFS transporter, partial [Tidjanibacter sp.]|nr:MFS transporter [Tidjanibacter sp.]